MNRLWTDELCGLIRDLRGASAATFLLALLAPLKRLTEAGARFPEQANREEEMRIWAETAKSESPCCLVFCLSKMDYVEDWKDVDVLSSAFWYCATNDVSNRIKEVVRQEFQNSIGKKTWTDKLPLDAMVGALAVLVEHMFALVANDKDEQARRQAPLIELASKYALLGELNTECGNALVWVTR